MYVVTGVSGNTGRVVAEALLHAGQKVRVVVRSEDKGRPFKDRGAEVAVASVEDAGALGAALHGATGAYLLIPPPGPEVKGILARGARIADAFAAALSKNPLPHAVLLSSIGAQHPDGTGPIASLHHAEQALSATKGTFTFLRAGYFMENLYGMLGAVQGAGILPSLFNPNKAIPMIATQDIGQTAAQALLHPPAATEIIELSGPREYSFADAAAAFSQVLGKTINVVPVPPEGIVPALVQAGLGEEMAGLYREMAQGIDSGRVDFVGSGARQVRGTVTLESVVRKILGVGDK
jgi:uncharacterized protein YbjT (DUF2867 family)